MQRQRLPESACRISCSVGLGFSSQERHQGHQEAGRAEAALQAVRLPERLLQRVELAGPRRQPLDRRQLAAVGLHGEHQAGAHRLAVEQDRAGAAHAVLAADVGAGQAQLVAQEVGEQQARLDLALVGRAVDVSTR